MTIKRSIVWEYGKGPIVEQHYDGPAPRSYTSVRPRAAFPAMDDTQEIRGALAAIAAKEGASDASPPLTCA